jgi:hypothetical protein
MRVAEKLKTGAPPPLGCCAVSAQKAGVGSKPVNVAVPVPVILRSSRTPGVYTNDVNASKVKVEVAPLTAV